MPIAEMQRNIERHKAKHSCANCGSKNSYGSHFRRWRGFKTKWLCHKCYTKFYSNPRRMWFKKQRIYLPKCPRKGKCAKCKETVKSGELKFTHIHHKKYYKRDPLRETIELCNVCHGIAGCKSVYDHEHYD